MEIFMGVKLVKNFGDGTYSSLNSELLLQVVDGNSVIGKFKSKHYYIFNPITNERFEIMPELLKYCMADVQYGCSIKNDIFFTCVKQINEKDVEISFCRYNIIDANMYTVHKTVSVLDEINETIVLKVFVLSKDYCIFEKMTKDKDGERFEIVLKDMPNDKNLIVNNPELNKNGIDKILHLHGNLCCIKLGKKLVGVINVNRFVSDMVINLKDLYIETLDRTSDDVIIPYLGINNGYLVYSKYDKASCTEEIILYDWANKIKKVRHNNTTQQNSNLNNICVIEDVLYYIYNDNGGTNFINLDTQKTEFLLKEDVEFLCVFENLIMTKRNIPVFFNKNKEKSYIEVYRFPDFKNIIFKTKGVYRYCLKHLDDLLIFIG